MDKIEKHCYKLWLKSDKTWNHYLTARILEKQLNNEKT
jgi:hypothetical protein